jgi:hypothetical protein
MKTAIQELPTTKNKNNNSKPRAVLNAIVDKGNNSTHLKTDLLVSTHTILIQGITL